MDTIIFFFCLRTFSYNKGEIRSARRQNLKFFSVQNDRMNSNGNELKMRFHWY